MIEKPARQINTVIMTFIILGLMACITTPHVSTKVENGIHLEQYKTYRLQPGKIYSEPGRPADPAGVEAVLKSDIPKELEQRGLKLSTDNPDLIFTYAATRRLEHTQEEGWAYHEGIIDLMAVDATGQKVWSSHLQAILDPSDKTYRQLKEAIVRAFKNYPSVK